MTDMISAHEVVAIGLMPFDHRARAPEEYAMQPRPLVLIVDDDVYIGDLVKEVLDDAGYELQIAANAEMAFRIAQRDNPDLILTDYKMPLSDGVSLYWRIKGEPALQAIPFTLMSSRRARLPGMEGVPFLPKPFDIDDVITFVQRHCRQSPKADQA